MEHKNWDREYRRNKEELVAGAGFEPTTFGL